jgi:hypothetical protein
MELYLRSPIMLKAILSFSFTSTSNEFRSYNKNMRSHAACGLYLRVALMSRRQIYIPEKYTHFLFHGDLVC